MIPCNRSLSNNLFRLSHIYTVVWMGWNEPHSVIMCQRHFTQISRAHCWFYTYLWIGLKLARKFVNHTCLLSKLYYFWVSNIWIILNDLFSLTAQNSVLQNAHVSFNFIISLLSDMDGKWYVYYAQPAIDISIDWYYMYFIFYPICNVHAHAGTGSRSGFPAAWAPLYVRVIRGNSIAF